MEFLKYNKCEYKYSSPFGVFLVVLKLYYKKLYLYFFILLLYQKVVNWCIQLKFIYLTNWNLSN